MANTTTDITIRNATKKDCARLAEIAGECFSEPWSLQAFADALDLDYALFFVAQAEKVVGYVGLYQSFEEAEIVNVAVCPDFRRCHIASRLMRRLLSEARKRGIVRIFLEVRQSNKAAAALYEKYRFSVYGTRRGFYAKPKEDAVLMEQTVSI